LLLIACANGTQKAREATYHRPGRQPYKGKNIEKLLKGKKNMREEIIQHFFCSYDKGV
jgi:hypothetical protein